MYRIEISHEGLHKYREIKGKDIYVVKQKALKQKKAWEEQWMKKKLAEEKRVLKEQLVKEKEDKLALAKELTLESEAVLEEIEDTLKLTLTIDDRIDWDDLKDFSEFLVPEPKEPNSMIIPKEPHKSDKEFIVNASFLDKIISSRLQKKLKEMDIKYSEAHKDWKDAVEELQKGNVENHKIYQQNLQEWKDKKELFLNEQQEKNAAIDSDKESYLKGIPSAVMDYCDMVLTNSMYPDTFPQEFDVEYNYNNGTLIVDYVLPSLEDVPTLKEVKYVQSRDEYKYIHLSQSALNKVYDNLLYQICLRSIHELFEADEINVLKAIVFNGWVNSIDKSTGKETTGCILSVQALKDEFEEINLEHVDPKMCFKNLKGVGSSKLHSLSPIAPIIKIDRNDARFVSGYDIADTLDETKNLAAMDWQDFEQLIREIFEQEFNQSGGEVKITRASRDGGVDAIAFDPDPIRGGKIVIQAKRYTNIVGVSAVRDLYGTVLNEGATKGILVSTADYGPDAYSFAKGKPLTLLNGNNLLHLLSKYGHNAKIDLKEAKRLLKQQ